MTLPAKTLLLALVALPSLAAYDRSENLKPQDYQLFEELSRDLRCPACQGLSVWESDAVFSNQIKDMVKTKINAGLSKEEILAFFTARFGYWILREPPRRGFSALAWWLPLTLLLGGPLLLWFFFWRRKKISPAQGVRSVEAIIAQMQHELAQRRTHRPSLD